VRRWAVTISLLIVLFSNSAWIVGCTTVEKAGASAAAADDSDVPDCCKNGICPYHREHPQHVHTPPADTDCTCHMSANTSALTATSQVPAVYPLQHDEFAVLSASYLPVLLDVFAGAPDLAILTPPPRS
jgi:hypothetical protein